MCKQYEFKAEEAREEAVRFIRSQSERHNFKKVVLGISGGKDSTVAAALCCRALGRENVHGMLLPNGIQYDLDDSIEVCNALGIEYDTINIKPIYDAFLLQYSMSTLDTVVLTEESKINLGPRIRMSILRLWGQSHHHRLCGTGNLSEITVGYCTKDGDTSCDLNPLGRLTSVEVVEIGKTMEEIPLRLVVKTPSDGLCGLSDEEKLGLSYDDIHKYIRGIKLCDATWYKIQRRELGSIHKRTMAPVYEPSDKVLYSKQ